MDQLHRRLSDEQVKVLLQSYYQGKIARADLQEMLGVEKTHFFALLKSYRQNTETFSIAYVRTTPPRLSAQVEREIEHALLQERQIVEDPQPPISEYTYTALRDRLRKQGIEVSVTTIINRAKKLGCHNPRRKKKSHDREVITSSIGALVQHDASPHLWSPFAQEKWALITSIDDFSRKILFADFFPTETAWAHILVLQNVVLKYGAPFLYYVDSHSIFRFVQGRDSLWRKHYTLTDEADPQWKQVMDDCSIKVIYALSPQARGKIERPYGWLQDRLVRTCVRENVTDIREAQRVLIYEIHRYNCKQVHSTTQEVPYFRFQRALNEKRSLFREFKIRPPFQSVKDIFCLKMNRTIDPYRRISINNLQLNVNHATPRKQLNLRIYPLNNEISEIRFWCENKLIDVQKIRAQRSALLNFEKCTFQL